MEQGTFQNLNLSDDSTEVIELLNYFIQLHNEESTIRFSLDSRYYSLQIGGLYYSLMDKLLTFFLKNNNSIVDELYNLLRDFHLHFKNKIIPYEILIPLKGINFVRKASVDIPDLDFVSKRSEIEKICSKQISVKIFKDMRIIRNDFSIVGIATETHNSQKDTINHAIGLSAKSYIPFEHKATIPLTEKGSPHIFELFPKEFLSITKNTLWKELKKILCFFSYF